MKRLRCGDCCLCCALEDLIVNVHYSEAPDLDIYFGGNGTAYIRKDEDGRCVYLKDGRCSIYERRPDVCRTFTCERFATKQEQAMHNVTTLEKTIYPLARAAARMRRRTRQSLARRFNDLMKER
jgi:Fe-S-cluster containining protein